MKYCLAVFFSWSLTCFADIHAILLAGGGGTRLWPLSTNDFPKQFIDFGDGESLLQKTIQRLLLIDHLGQIVIATSPLYENLVRAQIEPYLNHASIRVLIEPERKNTAPAIAFACKFLMENSKESDAVLIVPSDHLIEPGKDFALAVAKAMPALEMGKIVTFGIKPIKPETGYGYLKLGEQSAVHIFPVERFIEKPSKEKAQDLIRSDKVYWNSGIFAFSLRTFWEELNTHSPKIAELSSRSFLEMKHLFSDMPDISIDYAIMEKSKKIVAFPLQIQWSDIGSWDSIYENSAKDAAGNVLQGNICQIGSTNNLILSKKRLIAAIDIDNLMIIETDDAILIAKRGESQKVKALLNKLKEQ